MPLYRKKKSHYLTEGLKINPKSREQKDTQQTTPRRSTLQIEGSKCVRASRVHPDTPSASRM